MDFYLVACAPQHRMNTIDRTHYSTDRQESFQLQTLHLIHDRTINRDILYTVWWADLIVRLNNAL